MASYTYKAKGIMKTKTFTYLPQDRGSCLSAHMVVWIVTPLTVPELLHSGIAVDMNNKIILTFNTNTIRN